MGRPTSKVTRVVVTGPLAPFAAAYKTRLAELGYTPLSIVNELRQVAHLSRWMQLGDISVEHLDREQLEQFLAPRRAAAGSKACSLRGLLVLAEMLDSSGVVRRERHAPTSPEESLLVSFRRYLLAERGLAEGTADAYVARAQRFLAGCGSLATLTSAEVTRAVQCESERVSVGSTQYFVAGVRAFLRFCFIEGLIGADLSAAALAVTGRRRSSLPRGISQSDALSLLRACDRRRSDGRRDYAILVMLVRLGMRAGEVARLTLDGIDWRAGEIVVHGKGRRVDRLPLPVDVGEALVAYLQRGRPRTDQRELFLRTVAPIGPLGRGGVSCVVRRACRRAGIPETGAHRLRHTVASEMLAAGADLGEIGQVLRHRARSSTAIYARVDVNALREIALPWPGGAR